MEPETSVPQVRRPWPTRRIFWNLAAAMIGFGLAIGVWDPFIAVADGVPAAHAMRPFPFAVATGAGILVGLVNFLIVSRVVGHRLHAVSTRLSAARRDIADSVGTDSWQPLADRYGLPVYSQDDFGRTAACFNYLLSSIDWSRAAERELRLSLVEQAKLAALGTLTAGVAHETKNPLNFVVNFAELNLELCDELREITTGDGDEPVSDLLSDLQANSTKILHHAERALAVMATMLQVGRSAAGDAHSCRLDQIVEQSAALAEHSWRAGHQGARCAIHVELDDADPVVRGVEGDLVQVMINLVMNGLEAAASVTDRVGEVRVSVQHEDGWATVVVADNGPGIDPEALPHIFEPFFTTKHGSGGTGLGLSISKNIIDNRHHGQLDVSSQPGSGARFVVRLPLESVPAAAATPA
ncbi:MULTISPECIES: sensor histidine kinase [unclassified Mycobacterium]|uniref:sensor histidine kinase n=1 Tax=unclassified Mycobacterium TaxID=2642494 RepID=UPI000A40300D|nr:MULTISPECIES: HAMP domain-containing sensor histidine kinase [unclassified Mycobacterium]